MEEIRDPESGAIKFKKTPEELSIERVEGLLREIKPSVDYIARFLKRYEPVFENLLSSPDK